jgi:hypothetical protein
MEYTLAFCTLRYSAYNLPICALHVVYNLRTLSSQRIVINIVTELRTVLIAEPVSSFNL